MKIYKNGTPYSDAAWKLWYGIESSSEKFERVEEYRELVEAENEAKIDQAIEDKYHNHGDRR